MKRLRPFFPYYGSKWRLAPKYPAPLYDTIIEPFAGSAQYATLYYDRKVVLCDLSEYVCGVWDYLIKATEADILRLPSVVDCVDDFPDLCQEEKWLIGFWLNVATVKPCNKISAWGKQIREFGCNFWSERNKEMLANQVQYIKHWQIYQLTFQQLAEFWNPYATWFIDPPYMVAGRHYLHGVNYRELASYCANRLGQVIVCESHGAYWLPFQELCYIQSTHKQWSKEVVYHAHH